jgi:4-amino-4-deoxy-L-arabinose transferase-like glycosyltransferase
MKNDLNQLSSHTRIVRYLFILFLVAFSIRAGAVIALRDVNAAPLSRVTGADGVEYNLLGLRFAQGKGYTWSDGRATSFRAPGLPLLLAGLYSVFGENYPIAYVAFCLLGAATCVGTYGIARELLNERAARWAGWLACFYVPHVYFATRFDSENLFAACLAGGTFMALLHLRTRWSWSALAAGLFLGCGGLTRAFAILLLPMMACILAFTQTRAFSMRKRLIGTILFGVAFVAVIAPWTIRNYNVHGRVVLIATNGGSTFYGGNNSIVLEEPHLLGAWIATTLLPERDLVDAAPDEVSHDQVEWRLGMEWVRNNVTRLPLLWLYKFVRFWLPDIESANKSYLVLQLVGTTPFLVLIVVGLIRCLRRSTRFSGGWLLIHVILLSSVLTALIFWGSPRFRDANTPILMVYAAVGFCWFRGVWFRSPEMTECIKQD